MFALVYIRIYIYIERERQQAPSPDAKHKQARATLAQIILFVFLPPFLFASLVRAVSLESLAEW